MSGGLKPGFDCNVCYENPVDPVVTKCGHLYCWKCLHSWLEKGVAECPVCKAGVTKESVIPVYGQGSSCEDRRDVPKESVPERPNAQRDPPPRRREGPRHGFTSGASIHIGVFPFGLTVNIADWFGGTDEETQNMLVALAFVGLSMIIVWTVLFSL
ncbi:putative ring-finger E3 ubiquitin ligase [Gregarina niphandrodes]|uniref:RING-type E3 ubiquitin transferase n=1 Tax=Gregarina niphandrodes TaxID=110365 RepID=A0A023B6H9_GRENI|nr:putative ring-finger E3 ubiquitin ligase [Gregarina niphandrodes]EZG66564.1 putative ring-finger E3 ubiquitin ligase [Gregarina niphandrodes]|eukprot:XP_011130597.1 putative ring-finger E3 ubiquitin ligase [Gregarina niphandrodes]